MSNIKFNPWQRVTHINLPARSTQSRAAVSLKFQCLLFQADVYRREALITLAFPDKNNKNSADQDGERESKLTNNKF
jgi:hypothetical protein